MSGPSAASAGGGAQEAEVRAARERSRQLERFRGFLEGRPRIGPQTVHLDVANSCNLSCVTCWNHSAALAQPKPASWKRQRVEPAAFFRALDQVAEAGAERIILSGGGEPFTHPDIERFAAGVKARGLRLTLITNGTRCDFARLRALEVDQILLNIASASREGYAAYHPNQDPEVFDRLVEGVQTLRGVAAVNLVQVINRVNAGDLVEMIELAARLGARSSFKVSDVPRGAERYALAPEQRARLLEDLIPTARERAKALRVKHNLDAYAAQLAGASAGPPPPACYAGYFYSRISIDGAVLFCCAALEAGNLADGSFGELWEGERYQALRERLRSGRLFPACARCGKHDMNFALGQELSALQAEGALSGSAAERRDPVRAALGRQSGPSLSAEASLRTAAPAGPEAGPGARMRPAVSWNIVGGCNYRCSYCVQKRARGLGAPSEAELEGALSTLAALPGRWEVKISGGEPFLLERLPEIAARLGGAGHLVSVLTNLSAPLAAIDRFLGAAQGQLRTFSCSFHREAVSEDEFLEKALAVKARLAAWPKASFVVNAVLVPGAIDAARASFERFSSAGIKFYPQLMRKDGALVAYGARDWVVMDEAFGELRLSCQMNRGYALKGRRCHAGSRYFIVHPRGEAFRCYPAKRAGEGRLGSVFDGSLRLRDGPEPCPYEVCPCTVPQNRGIVEGAGARGGGVLG